MPNNTKIVKKRNILESQDTLDPTIEDICLSDIQAIILSMSGDAAMVEISNNKKASERLMAETRKLEQYVDMFKKRVKLIKTDIIQEKMIAGSNHKGNASALIHYNKTRGKS